MSNRDDPDFVPGTFKNMSKEELEKIAWQYHKRLSELERSLRSGPFISGGTDDKDEMGLPSKIFVCPAYGLEGSAVYTKTKDYSGPTW